MEKARRSDRRSFLLGSGGIALLGAAAFPDGVRAQAWPERPVRIYETFGLLEKPTTPEGFVALYREEGPVMIAIARELGVSLD